jgi:hypothetical protein
MSTLSSLATRLQQLAVGSPRPDRDALAAERDRLRAEPAAAPGNTVQLPERPADRCRCADCVRREQDEDDLRVRFFAWEARLRVVETQLSRLTFGTASDDERKDERDAPGRALAVLRDDILRGIDAVRARRWELTILRDGRGRPLGAWETHTVNAEVLRELMALYRATDAMVFLGRAELVAGLQTARDRLGALLVREIRSALDPAVAERVGVEPGQPTAATESGLVPGTSPDNLSGTVRFVRKGRA